MGRASTTPSADPFRNLSGEEQHIWQNSSASSGALRITCCCVSIHCQLLPILLCNEEAASSLQMNGRIYSEAICFKQENEGFAQERAYLRLLKEMTLECLQDKGTYCWQATPKGEPGSMRRGV